MLANNGRTKDDDLYMEVFDKDKALESWPQGKLSPRERDLSGEAYGRWRVMYPTEKVKNNRKYVCHCACGTVRTVNAGSLRANRTHSCGCLGQSADGVKLHPGMIWNEVEILADTKKRTTKGEIIFLCRDADGVEFEQKSTNIKSGQTKSAGLSKGELTIYHLLKDAGHKVQIHYKIPLEDFIAIYDFLIDDKYIIEFDGEQHFTSTFYSEDLNHLRTHDLQKNDYCFSHEVPLIRIPYYVDIKLEDLLLETSKYILTREKEEEYYAINS